MSESTDILECLGCEMCEEWAFIRTLYNGKKVCMKCPELLIEQEARELLRMRYEDRIIAIERRKHYKTEDEIAKLKDVMFELED